MENKISSQGFIQHYFSILDINLSLLKINRIKQHSKNFRKNSAGFTLIELLVVVAIIALLSSVMLVAVQQSRMKGRNAKRLADMTQMASVLELFYNTNKGYPSSTVAGIPDNITPGFAARLPASPVPADGSCASPNSYVSGVDQNTYYYAPSGTPSSGLYPDYTYYFCLGDQTGNFGAGQHMLTSKGLK